MYAVKFGGKMSQEEIDETISKYTGQDWSVVDVPGYVAFVSPCGGWFHSYNKETSRGMFIDQKWISKLKLVDVKQKEVLQEEVSVSEEDKTVV